MDDLFEQLEHRIKALKRRCDQTEQVNLVLKQNKSLLQREKEALMSKNKVTISQIENMVLRLKSLEKSS